MLVYQWTGWVYEPFWYDHLLNYAYNIGILLLLLLLLLPANVLFAQNVTIILYSYKMLLCFVHICTGVAILHTRRAVSPKPFCAHSLVYYRYTQQSCWWTMVKTCPRTKTYTYVYNNIVYTRIHITHTHKHHVHTMKDEGE